MKTTTANANNSICPVCHGKLAQDHKGRKFVRHIDYGDKDYCDHERGEKD